MSGGIKVLPVLLDQKEHLEGMAWTVLLALLAQMVQTEKVLIKLLFLVDILEAKNSLINIFPI